MNHGEMKFLHQLFLHPNHIFSNILSENEQEKGINYLHHLLSELSDEEESNPFQGETSSQKEYLITHPIINEKVDDNFIEFIQFFIGLRYLIEL